VTDISKISNDLDKLEEEISTAEKELAAGQAKKELLQQQGEQHGVKNVAEAKELIAKNQKELSQIEKEIVGGYADLKSKFEWE
jgi:predicted  nucleic acid-binding Zn-ribbon protein